MTKYTRYSNGTLEKCQYCKKPGVLVENVYLGVSCFGSFMYFDYHKRCIGKARKEEIKFQERESKRGVDFTPWLFRKNV